MDDNQNYYTPEEAKAIRRRIMELPAPGPEAEADFHLFLECLRRNAVLYSSLLFGRGDTKLIDFNLTLNRATIKDPEGNVVYICLSLNKP